MKTESINTDNAIGKPSCLSGMNCNILTPTKGLSKADWLRFRQMGIGGSDIASACGINSWKSPLALWHEKTMKIEEDEEENLPAELGIFLEPFMKERFEKWIKKEEGIDIIVESIPYILQHKENPIALANLDGVLLHPDKLACITEYKTTSEYFYKQWQDENLPDNYYLQVQWYLYVTGLEYCYLSFLIGNRKFDLLVIERNQEVIDEIVEKADYFWKTFVIPKVAPAPSGDISSGETLKKLYPKEKGGTVIDCTGDKDLEHNFIKIDFVNEQIKGLKEELEVNKQAIQAKQGDNEILICGEVKSTWKEQFRKEYIVKAGSSRVFRISKNKGGN
ncbi:MAG: YqaJ viral recombinase family protein [Candidatus Atribacteria bacterium]|nr:YqaJ viral recombinase family protein [Candidatus Atribacteria bacterium]